MKMIGSLDAELSLSNSRGHTLTLNHSRKISQGNAALAPKDDRGDKR